MWRYLISLLVALFIAAPAFAGPMKDKDKKVREFNFDEDVLTVDFLKPDLEFVGLVKQEDMASLIEIRKDFVDEIVRSAEDL